MGFGAAFSPLPLLCFEKLFFEVGGYEEEDELVFEYGFRLPECSSALLEKRNNFREYFWVLFAREHANKVFVRDFSKVTLIHRKKFFAIEHRAALVNSFKRKNLYEFKECKVLTIVSRIPTQKRQIVNNGFRKKPKGTIVDECGRA